VSWAIGIGGQAPWHVDAASALGAAIGPASVVDTGASESLEDHNNNGIPDDDGAGVPDERPTPPPGNDDCHIGEDPPDPNRPPTGAFTICAGDPDHPELGEWLYYDGLTPLTRLGICEKWPGYPETPPDFGQVCYPLDQTSCTDPPNIPYTNNMCFPWGYDPVESELKPAYECYVGTDNQTASTDGPTAAGDCLGSGENSFRADVWYTVTAPCTGKAIIDMCTALGEYNSMLAVFGDHTNNPRCPSIGDDNLDLLYCNDDYCMGDETLSAISWETTADAVYILRLGGYSATGTDADAAQGWSTMHAGFYCEPPPPNAPALPDNPTHQANKHRYISVNPNTNPDEDTVLKVEVAEMRRCQNAPTRACMTDSDCDDVCNDVAGDPPYYTLKCPPNDCSTTDPPSMCIWSGPCVDLAPTFEPPLAWFVQEPCQITDGCRAPGCDQATENCCDDEDWIARLSDHVYVEPSRWQDYDLDGVPNTLLHIGDCAIVPGITYAVHACRLDDLGNCSEPLMVATAKFPLNARPTAFPLFGDVCGGTQLPGPTVLPPDGYASVKDLLIMHLTIINYGSARLPQMHPTWADMHGSGRCRDTTCWLCAADSSCPAGETCSTAGIPPNYILNVVDLMAVYVFGLVKSDPWVNTMGGLDPQDCP
jgi:hypothetical protein